ncbi:MAG: CehA/McbA family metallohydrolase [Verrucomicrobiota bacterium]
MKRRSLIGTAIGSILGLVLPDALAATTFRAFLVDDTSGQPAAARAAITDSAGKFVEIDGQHAHVQYLEKKWCYVDASFSLTVPESGMTIELRRGLETLPLSWTVTNRLGPLTERTFRLHRWTDMRAKGYWEGDIHAHLPVPQEAHLQMRAEDLNAVTLLYLPEKEQPIAVNDCFTGKLDAHSTSGCEILVGQEVQDFQMGHLNLMGLTNLVADYPEMGGTMEYWRSRPHWDLGRAMRAARSQNATIVWAHVCSLPGAQLPVGLALGLVDGIELLTWNDPVQLPNHWSPWLNSGMSQAEFPVMRAVDLYYQFLNAGFRVPIAAGTDKFYEEIPLGSNRTYARVEEPVSYASWLAGVRAGKTFVSNGPMLELSIGRHRPGDIVEFSGTNCLQARAQACSILPFTTLEIVWNGEVVGHRTVPIPQNPPPGGLYSMEIEARVPMARSGWLAARVVDHPDLRNRILPRGVSVFAHTSPIYFLRDGRKVREEASIAYLRKYVQGLLHWLDTNPPFVRETDREQARRDAEQALQLYRTL